MHSRTPCMLVSPILICLLSFLSLSCLGISSSNPSVMNSARKKSFFSLWTARLSYIWHAYISVHSTEGYIFLIYAVFLFPSSIVVKPSIILWSTCPDVQLVATAQRALCPSDWSWDHLARVAIAFMLSSMRLIGGIPCVPLPYAYIVQGWGRESLVACCSWISSPACTEGNVAKIPLLGSCNRTNGYRLAKGARLRIITPRCHLQATVEPYFRSFIVSLKEPALHCIARASANIM